MYDAQAEMDAAYCDICGHHHSPSCWEAQWTDDDEED